MTIDDIKKFFYEETGLIAIKVFQLGLSLYAIEASDGNTYHIQ